MKQKSILFILIILLISCNNSDKEAVLQEVNTTENKFSIKVNDKIVKKDWSVALENKLNVFEVECKLPNNNVVFRSSKDSIKLIIKEKDTVSFNIILNKKDTVITHLVGVEPNINFTEEYIKANKGNVTIAIPEVSELANILVALHKDAERDKNMTDSDTEYYQRVKQYFKPYLNHPMLDTIEKHIGGLRKISDQDSIFSNDSYLYYISLKMNACNYFFNEHDSIVNNGFIKEMAKGWHTFDPMKDAAFMADFAKKSNFRAFYNENRSYYDSLLITYKKLNPISKMQKWLDNKFGFSYGNYSVYFSPLVGGAHSAQKFKESDFNQSIMFIARASHNEKYSEIMNELLESRVVFTEIDHNYVNPISDKYLEKINEAFANREKWVKGGGTELYKTPYMIFNEYMTFAFYSLYVNDNFNKEDLLAFLPKMENQMKERGFIKFKGFNRELLNEHQKNKENSVDNLYKHMFNWSLKQK